MGDFRERALSATIWSSVHRFGTLGISFVSSVILARLITPEEYGCVGLLAIFIELSNTLINGGFGNALIQKSNANNEDFSTVFYWNILLSIILYIILLITSNKIAIFFNTEILKNILKVEGLVIIFNALGLVYDVRLKKSLNFQKLTFIDIGSTIVSILVCISMAYLGYGVWSLVAQYISFALVRLVLLFLFDRWLPLLTFNKYSFISLFSFGGFMLFTTILNTLSRNIQGLIIGRKFSPTDMGFFAKAKTLEEIPSMSLSSIVSQISLPLFSEIQEDKEKMRHLLKSLNIFLSFFIIPLMFLLIIIAKPLILILFSDVWIESVPYFKILCVAGIFICLQDVNYFAVASLGKSKELFKWTIIKQVFNISVLILGVYFAGIKGMLYCMVIAAFFIFIVNLLLSKKYIGLDFKLIISRIFLALVYSGISSILPFLFGIKFSDLNPYLLVIIQSAIFITLYLFLIAIIKIKEKDDMVNILKLFIHKFIKKCKH